MANTKQQQTQPPDTVRINVALPRELHTRLRVYCLENRTEMKDVVRTALEQFPELRKRR
jgi:hypothetical protein